MVVKRLLESLSGRSVSAEWAGDASPADTNDTVKGRNRNRRVDIHFLPIGGVTPAPATPEPAPNQEPPRAVEPPPAQEPVPKKEPPPTKEPPGKKDDDPSFCIEHPLVCAGLGIGGVALLFCILNPAVCLPKIPPILPPVDPGKPDKDKDKDKQKKGEHPCVARVDLPSGTIKAKTVGMYLIADFEMGITFEEDPARGCLCRLGEYRQMINGFAERDGGTGVMKPADPPGLKLDRSRPQEDLRGGFVHYGWRSETAIGNVDTDQFLPDRDTGCEYKGKDAPSMSGGVPGETKRFHFEFRGGPVDRRNRSIELGSWSKWIVEGEQKDSQIPAT